jgi:hypothetical protein
LGSCAAEQGRRVRYLTCAQLVNELVEAADDKQLSRVLGRYARLDLLCLDLCRHGDYAEAVAVVGLHRRRCGRVVGIVAGFRGTRGSCRLAGSGRVWQLPEW